MGKQQTTRFNSDDKPGYMLWGVLGGFITLFVLFLWLVHIALKNIGEYVDELDMAGGLRPHIAELWCGSKTCLDDPAREHAGK